MFRSFYSSQARSRYFLIFSLYGPLEKQNQLDDTFFCRLTLLFHSLRVLHQRKFVVFLLSLSDSKSLQVSWTLLSILAVLIITIIIIICSSSSSSRIYSFRVFFTSALADGLSLEFE